MSLFTQIFGNSNKDSTEIHVVWNPLKQITQLDDIISESFHQPVIIFKHSTRCSISRMALKQFEIHYSAPLDTLKPYFLDLLAYRELSNEIASRFNVMHQSPQLLLIKEGKCVYTASHSDIDADELITKI